ncbi:protein kinase domain-containing protein [Colletotrichum chrysophilum]|uniref:Protein kinase domain-containing protein n=1 Tax=Colletotrichum chrysophilum TaxID=1836956 RepID=A0AAD9EQ13_9PEZI|nr:protein kinase domain-containing protein [Colletotrichum chrysophilum]
MTPQSNDTQDYEVRYTGGSSATESLQRPLSIRFRERNSSISLSSGNHSSPAIVLSPTDSAYNTPTRISLPWQNNYFTGDIEASYEGSNTALGSRRSSITSGSRSVSLVRDLGISATQSSQSSVTSDDGEDDGIRFPIESYIRQKIRDRLEWNQMHAEKREQYLPIDSFEEIFTVLNITRLMQEKFPDIVEGDLEEKILRITQCEQKCPAETDGSRIIGRRRILAMLIHMGQLDHIDAFIEENVCDGHLPIQYTEKDNRVFVDRASQHNETLFRSWERFHIDQFHNYQSVFFVPFFDIGTGFGINSYDFESDIRLPWKEHELKTNGGNGVIYRLLMHPSHHNFKETRSSDGSIYFAVKEVDAVDRLSYKQELKALERSGAYVKQEKHLIKLLFTYQYRGRLYLVFEWADGNLMEFWQNPLVHLEPFLTREKWAIEQCWGIANAIALIHGLSRLQKSERCSMSDSERDAYSSWGRHGDIKPNNILWFSSYGDDRNLLVVSDLGLTRYHSAATKSLVSRIDGCTPTYRAPEFDLHEPITPTYDVWRLGCVYIEFFTWYIEGMEGFMEFEDARTNDYDEFEDVCLPEVLEDNYFVILQTESAGRRWRHARLKSSVTEWLNRLRRNSRCTTAISKFLDIIEQKMLVTDAKDRSHMDMITSEIAGIYEKLR